MDANKADVLHAVGYKVFPTCSRCTFFRRSDSMFGECSANKYKHLKHSGGERLLSVMAGGGCDSFTELIGLGAWEQFV